jgi:hypothetical protein
MGSSGSGQQRAVIVAAGAPDRRLTDALRSASHIPARERSAVHVDVASDATSALGIWWMECQPSDVGLLVVDNCGGVGPTLAQCAAAQLARGFEEVVVLAGFWQARQARRWLLHDRTAESVCVAVNRVPGVTGVLVPVPARATPLPVRERGRHPSAR